MQFRSLRFCHVAPEGTARQIAEVLERLGLENTFEDGAPFPGAVFPSDEGGSWVEVWAEGEGMPAGTMLQIVVDDADAMARRARDAGFELMGPMEAYGERIYALTLPGGLQMAFLSKLGDG